MRKNPRLPANMYERYDLIRTKPESAKRRRKRLRADEYYHQTAPEQYAGNCPACGEYTVYIDTPGREERWRCPSCGREGTTPRYSFSPPMRRHLPDSPPVPQRPRLPPTPPPPAWEDTLYYVWEPATGMVLGIERRESSNGLPYYRLSRYWRHDAGRTSFAGYRRWFFETLTGARELLRKIASTNHTRGQTLEIRRGDEVIEQYQLGVRREEGLDPLDRYTLLEPTRVRAPRRSTTPIYEEDEDEEEGDEVRHTYENPAEPNPKRRVPEPEGSPRTMAKLLLQRHGSYREAEDFAMGCSMAFDMGDPRADYWNAVRDVLDREEQRRQRRK